MTRMFPVINEVCPHIEKLLEQVVYVDGAAGRGKYGSILHFDADCKKAKLGTTRLNPPISFEHGLLDGWNFCTWCLNDRQGGEPDLKGHVGLFKACELVLSNGLKGLGDEGFEARVTEARGPYLDDQTQSLMWASDVGWVIQVIGEAKGCAEDLEAVWKTSGLADENDKTPGTVSFENDLSKLGQALQELVETGETWLAEHEEQVQNFLKCGESLVVEAGMVAPYLGVKRLGGLYERDGDDMLVNHDEEDGFYMLAGDLFGAYISQYGEKGYDRAVEEVKTLAEKYLLLSDVRQVEALTIPENAVGKTFKDIAVNVWTERVGELCENWCQRWMNARNNTKLNSGDTWVIQWNPRQAGELDAVLIDVFGKSLGARNERERIYAIEGRWMNFIAKMNEDITRKPLTDAVNLSELAAGAEQAALDEREWEGLLYRIGVLWTDAKTSEEAFHRIRECCELNVMLQ